MWFAPRRTVRSLMASEQRPSWIPVVVLAGVASSILALKGGADDALRETATGIGFAIFQGGVGLIYGLLISPFIIGLVGGWLRADGDAVDVRLAVAWGYLPVAATVVFWVPLLAVFGWEAVRMNPETSTAAQALFQLLYLPIGLAPLYSGALQIGGIAAALQTSIWRALAIVLIVGVPGLLLMVAFR